MDNFNLKKFLIENQLTNNSKTLSEGFDDIMYSIFKGKDGFKNRIKTSPEAVIKLAQISKEKGLNVDESGRWAWKEGSDKMDWNYDAEEGYLYYGDEYKDIIKNL
jgi:hypothetical protein